MKYEILDKTGKTKRCTVTSLEYNGEFMGKSYVLCKVESEVPIDFQTGDYLEYRGEKYEINYPPLSSKNAVQVTTETPSHTTASN